MTWTVFEQVSLQSQISVGETWRSALSKSCDALSFYGGAKLGNRTMLDALIPGVSKLCELISEGKSWREAMVRWL